MALFDDILKTATSSIAKNSTMKVAGKVAEELILATGKVLADANISVEKVPANPKVVVPRAYGAYLGRNFMEVRDELQAYGFSNFGFVIHKDLIKGWLTKDGEVSSIAINGKSEFKAKSKFPSDARVVIEYHTFKDKR